MKSATAKMKRQEAKGAKNAKERILAFSALLASWRWSVGDTTWLDNLPQSNDAW
jgi:hypothetical protein